ncbi:hypothetical protein [Curtobacterium sp. MCSS17_016]|uniref:hypothetical protein n=1 Tax=Curtobacterium sp. MCSS17_016 TaxID=2175644 RepID=UPI000DA88AF7|nr:hypothetical protein [Curtobacterium sp. MCSS17_016]WIE80859.1 hypothetical protein DEJ19_020295 [Curtobacterium sp. MCSS17_016]
MTAATATRLKDVPGAGNIDPTTGRTRSGGEYYFSRDGGAAAPQVELTAEPPSLTSLISSRKDALEHASFVTAQSTAAAGKQGDANREDWWRRSFGNAEWRDGVAHPKMPDDFTPSKSAGTSLTGSRRTSRRWYKGEDIAIRMPSVSAIKRYSASIDGATFDVPVQVANAAGDDGIQGWVRVTQHGEQWSVTGLGMNAKDSAGMSEAVRALLESRTPTVELSTVNDLRDRYRARVRAEGTQLETVASSGFIDGVAFDAKAGQLTLSMNGRHYAYPATEETYQTLKSSRSPGKVFNALIKGKPAARRLIGCDDCGRVYAPRAEHRCPAHHNAPKEQTGVWDRLARRGAWVRDGRPRK